MKGLIGLVLFLCMALQGCTEPGETTTMGAATGGVLGAGLGVIVGNQTGDPGSGLVVGALAGSGTGAALANSIEAQDQAIHTQDQAIERQERQIQAQRSEIDQLRRNTGDTISFRGGNSGGQQVNPIDFGARAALREDTLAANQQVEQPILSGECGEAQNEARQAQSEREAADKLFHLRRALRLCPSNADFHASIGEIYLSMGRKVDAEFEFKEALRINPDNVVASNQLRDIGSTIER